MDVRTFLLLARADRPHIGEYRPAPRFPSAQFQKFPTSAVRAGARRAREAPGRTAGRREHRSGNQQAAVRNPCAPLPNSGWSAAASAAGRTSTHGNPVATVSRRCDQSSKLLDHFGHRVLGDDDAAGCIGPPRRRRTSGYFHHGSLTSWHPPPLLPPGSALHTVRHGARYAMQHGTTPPPGRLACELGKRAVNPVGARNRFATSGGREKGVGRASADLVANFRQARRLGSAIELAILAAISHAISCAV